MCKEKDKIKLTFTEEKVNEIINSRRMLGRKRYGEGMDFSQDTSVINWAQQMIEELADALNYAVALKLRLEKNIVENVIGNARDKATTLFHEMDMDEQESFLKECSGTFDRNKRRLLEKS